jgi:hypothetical protein
MHKAMRERPRLRHSLAALALALFSCSGSGEQASQAGGGTGGVSEGAGGGGGSMLAGAGGGGGLKSSGGSASGAAGTAGGGASGGVGGNDVGMTGAQVTAWRDGALAAYTIIHDDVCAENLDSVFDIADPELSARGLRAGFGAIVGNCVDRGLWDSLETLREHGHEIVCHTWGHPNLVEDTGADLNLELDQATAMLDASLVGQATTYFIFPYDAFSDALIARLDALGYLGARAGERGLNPTEFSDPLRNQFDVWGATAYAEGPEGLQEYVDEAITNGGWANREFHAVGTEAWEPVPAADYTAHLDYVKSKVDAGELWMDTPSAVVRYRFARAQCGAPVVAAGSIDFPAATPDCSKYATELSVELLTTTDPTALVVTQAGAALSAVKLAPSRFRVNVDPTKGPAYVGGL